jgi:hypothetical protein
MKRVGDFILTLFSFDPKRRNFDHVMNSGGVGFKVQNDQYFSIVCDIDFIRYFTEMLVLIGL